MVTSSHAEAAPASGEILSRALVRAARIAGLTQRDLARVLGISEATATRIARGRSIDPDSKEGELAVLFLRMFRSLDAILGGHEENMRRWMHAENLHVRGVPAEMIESVTGLLHVVEYLDAVRGRG